MEMDVKEEKKLTGNSLKIGQRETLQVPFEYVGIGNLNSLSTCENNVMKNIILKNTKKIKGGNF